MPTSASSLTYVDSSALVKLVTAETESEELERYLREHPIRVSSVIASVEVRRAARLRGDASLGRAVALLRRFELIQLTDAQLDVAARVELRVLRSLDTIHLAAALSLGDELSRFVTYDARLAAAARGLGLVVDAPGAE